MPGRKLDLHTHYYPPAYFEKIRALPSEFSFDRSPSGQTILTYRGARFFGVTPPMTDVSKRLEDMDRVRIDVEVVSLSTPNVFFTDAQHQPEIARLVNDAYAELIAKHPTRFKAFASIPMDNPDAYALFSRDLERIHSYFAPYGVRCDTRYLARKMWIDCGRPAPTARQERPL